MAGPDGRPGIWDIYLRLKKPKDPFWNEWVSRPMAAPFVYLLQGTRVTPNQVTFASLFVALGAAASLLLWRSYAGLVAAALLVQAAFVLDCIDGQLARIRGTASVVGGHLDFLMDEIKAFTLVAGLAGRLGWQHMEGSGRGVPLAGPEWLTLGLLGIAVVASGISLTTFMRRPEYLQAGRPGPPLPLKGEVQGGGGRPSPPLPLKGEVQGGGGRPSLPGRAVRAIEWGGKTVLHYPGWFWLPAFLDRIDLFLLPYLAAHFLYLGRAGLQVMWRLGR